METKKRISSLPEKRLVEALAEKNLVFATAESCTGGLVAKRVTDVPGSSAVFSGGVVTYSNEMKTRFLGVKKETLAAHGAVSHETAYEMAKGLLEATGADVGVSLTGIAGPGGGSAEKPVGLVYVGVNVRGKIRTYKLLLTQYGTRARIRRAASDFALIKAKEAAEGVI